MWGGPSMKHEEESCSRASVVSRFRKVAGVSVVAADCLRSAIDTSTVDVQPSYYELILQDVKFYGIVQALTQATCFH